MAGLLDFNHGGATHPGARAIVHPGADSDEHVVLYAVVTETEEHITLDDGYTYDKRTGVVQGPAGRPSLQNRLMVTEGSTMFDSWSPIARTPHYPHPSEGSRRYSVSWDANGFPDERNHPPAPRAIIQRRDIADKPTNQHASRRHPPQMVPQPPTISTRKPPCVPTATTCGSKNVRQDVSYPFGGLKGSLQDAYGWAETLRLHLIQSRAHSCMLSTVARRLILARYGVRQ